MKFEGCAIFYLLFKLLKNPALSSKMSAMQGYQDASINPLTVTGTVTALQPGT